MRDERQNSSGVVVVVAGAAIVLFPVLYVLSIGPAAWLCEHGCLSEDLFELGYYPLLHISREGPETLGLPLIWYINLWLA